MNTIKYSYNLQRRIIEMTITSHPIFLNHSNILRKPCYHGRFPMCRRQTFVRTVVTRVVVAKEGPRVTVNDMKKFLSDNNIGYEEGFTCLVLDCPFCDAHGRHIHGRLFINMTTGSVLCLKCGNSGTWEDFADWLSLLKMGEIKVPWPKMERGSLSSNKEVEATQLAYENSSGMESFDEDELLKLCLGFNLEGIQRRVLEKYEARISTDRTRMLLPIFSVSGSRVGMHSVLASNNGDSKTIVETVPGNLSGVLFGYKQLNKRHDSVILAGSPLSVLAIAQQHNNVAVSLPESKSLPLEVLPLLEPFKQIILWLGNNLASWELSRIFARKLNERRCHFIRPQDLHPEPLDAIKNDVKISSILKSAHPVSHKAITTFNSLRKDVLAEFSHMEQVAGVKWKRYPLLSRLLKGHRKGELTIFTGPTGSGKTTFISEYSLDLCIQGVRTLWGSFEIRNSRLAKTMLTQFSQISLEKNLDLYDFWADRFERLPLYFLTFHGQQSIRSVLDAMRHAVYVHDIEHIIVDNLQFMMGTTESSHNMDRFWRQDLIVSSFRQFATVHNCHVTLVIHPRKENSEELTNMSIFGGAKASQEADNIMILQDKRLHALRGRKYIQVSKNRFDGELGIVPLEFDKETLGFALKKKPKKVDTDSVVESVTDQNKDKK